MTTTTPAQRAAVDYRSRVAEIEAHYNTPAKRMTKAFADEMTRACREYEAAMVKDIGLRRANRKGAAL
jgi:hypothetical protein